MYYTSTLGHVILCSIIIWYFKIFAHTNLNSLLFFYWALELTGLSAIISSKILWVSYASLMHYSIMYTIYIVVYIYIVCIIVKYIREKPYLPTSSSPALLYFGLWVGLCEILPLRILDALLFRWENLWFADFCPPGLYRRTFSCILELVLTLRPSVTGSLAFVCFLKATCYFEDFWLTGETSPDTLYVH